MVYIYLGQEQFLKRHALEELRIKVCGKDPSNLNYEEFQAGEDDLNKIIDCVKTAPFMARFRLIVVKDINRFDQGQKEAIAAFIKDLPSNAVLVLTADSILPANPIYNTVLKNGKIVNFNPLEDERLYRWVSDRFGCFNKKIQPSAIELLVGNTGNDLMRLNNAIESLAMFVGRAGVIKTNDIETLIGKSLEVSTFQIVDAVGYKNASYALKILNGLNKDTKSVLQIVGLIGWHLRRIWRAKKLLVQSRPKAQSAKQPDVSLSRVASLVGVPQYARAGFFNQVNNFSQLELEKNFKILLKLDRDLKTTSMEPRRALELLVVQLCASL